MLSQLIERKSRNRLVVVGEFFEDERVQIGISTVIQQVGRDIAGHPIEGPREDEEGGDRG